MYEVTYCTDGRRVSNSCIKEVSTCVNAFVMGYVGVERRDIKNDKKSVVGQLSKLFEFIKEVCSVTYKGLCSLCKRFKMIRSVG